MATISEYPLTNTGAEVQQAITDSLTTLPSQIGLKVNSADVLTKTNTTAYVPTEQYHPATKGYVDGVLPTISIGTTTTGEPGTDALVTNSGTAINPIFNFTIPRGNTGAAAGFGTPVVSTATLQPGESATVSITASGTDVSKIFNFSFGIPQGAKGETGNTGYYVNNVVRTSGTGASGTTDTYTMYINDTATTAIGTFNVYNGLDGLGAGTVTSIGLENVTDNSLTITNSPVTSSGVIGIKHRNSITAQSTQAFYPISIDSSGHITSYGSATVVGDMLKSVYDTNNNNIVDAAEHLNNGTDVVYFSIS